MILYKKNRAPVGTGARVRPLNHCVVGGGNITIGTAGLGRVARFVMATRPGRRPSGFASWRLSRRSSGRKCDRGARWQRTSWWFLLCRWGSVFRLIEVEGLIDKHELVLAISNSQVVILILVVLSKLFFQYLKILLLSFDNIAIFYEYKFDSVFSWNRSYEIRRNIFSIEKPGKRIVFYVGWVRKFDFLRI